MIIFIKFLLNNLVAFLLIVFVIFYFLGRYKKIQYFLLLFIILITISPFPNFLVYSFESLHKPGDINNLENTFDKIVILSGNEDYNKTKKYNQLYLGGTNNRIIEGLRIHRKFNKEIIFSGSSIINNKNNKRDIYVAKKFFKEFEVDKKFLIFDDKSENTLDTFVFLKENFPNKKHLIITSAMHMLRCKFLAKRNNIDFILYAVDYKSNNKSIFRFNINVGENIRLFNYGLREISALLFYKLSGKI